MRIRFLFLLITTVFFLNCSALKDNQERKCESTAVALVTEVNGLSETEVNKPVVLKVSFPVRNGCGNFNKFIETKKGKTSTIEVEAIYKGCYCTMNIPTIIANYTFTPSEVGTYTLRFKSAEDAFVEKVITVN